MQMNHQELAARLERRLDKIEQKLDKHLETTTTHESDLKWVKGYIKFSLTSLIALVGAVSTALFKLFIK